MKLVTNLVFKGECRQAFEFYAKVLGGKLTGMHTFGEAPGDMPIDPSFKDKIMHAWLDVGDQSLMGCDAPPGYQEDMGGFSATYHSQDAAETKRVYDALSEGGKITMPFNATFWSPGFGMFTDRFGTPWMVNTIPTDRQ